jgi:hypothetical protein
MRLRWWALCAWVLPACMGQVRTDETPPDAGHPTPDSGVTSGPDAGAADSGSPGFDSGSPAADGGRKVPLFVAQGSMGRSTLSCDDGQTWVANRAWDIDGDPLVCGSTTPVICYQGTETFDIGGQCQAHQPCLDSLDVAKGVVFGNGTFVATWGWGPAGVVRQSTNGIDWTTTHSGEPFGGIAFGAGAFVVASRSPFASSDGATWTASQTADFHMPDGGIIWSVRRFAYGDDNGGKFLAVADGDVLISSDKGVSWQRPSVLPQFGGAVSDYGDILYGNGVWVIVDYSGTANYSTDHGDTWTAVQTGVTEVLSRGIWTGSEFWIWGSGYRLSSPDGAHWTKTPLTSQVRLEGVVARNPLTGTLVAVDNVWNGYGQLAMLRSADGLTWTSLPAGAFAPSHPIWAITFGYADPSSACP